MAIVNAYQQADEPADAVAGTQWFRDDGTWAIMGLDLNWNEMGLWTMPDHGHLPVAGGTMIGNILGGHGLAGLESPAFTGSPTIEGDEIATKPWTTVQLDALQTTLQQFIASSFSGSDGTLTIGNNLAIGYGTVANGATIPLPKYADDDRASLSEVWAVIPSVRSLTGRSDSITSFNWTITCSVDANLLVTCTFAGWSVPDASINYLIICTR
jgi:hypothetical protein